MQTHVKVLGVLYLAVSAVFLVMALFLKRPLHQNAYSSPTVGVTGAVRPRWATA